MNQSVPPGLSIGFNSWVLYASCQNIGKHLVHLFFYFAKSSRIFAKHSVFEQQKMTWLLYHTCSLQLLCYTFMMITYSRSLLATQEGFSPTLLVCRHCIDRSKCHVFLHCDSFFSHHFGHPNIVTAKPKSL